MYRLRSHVKAEPGCAWQAGGEQELDTYFCGVLRMMPLANIDPSLAIAFYCRTRGVPHKYCLCPAPRSTLVVCHLAVAVYCCTGGVLRASMLPVS